MHPFWLYMGDLKTVPPNPPTTTTTTRRTTPSSPWSVGFAADKKGRNAANSASWNSASKVHSPLSFLFGCRRLYKFGYSHQEFEQFIFFLYFFFFLENVNFTHSKWRDCPSSCPRLGRLRPCRCTCPPGPGWAWRAGGPSGGGSSRGRPRKTGSGARGNDRLKYCKFEFKKYFIPQITCFTYA